MLVTEEATEDAQNATESDQKWSAEFRSTLAAAVEEAGRRLFRDYNVEMSIAEAGTSRSELTMVAVIGFLSDHLNGTIALGSNQQTINASCPLDDFDLSDWANELTNQLAGHFKRLLLRYGLNISINTPMALQGSDLSHGGQKADVTIHFRCESGSTIVWLDAQCSPGLELVEIEEEEDNEFDCAEDGELMFF